MKVKEERMSATRDWEKGGQKGLGYLKKSTGMEGVRERVNRGRGKGSGGHRGREMAAMNK